LALENTTHSAVITLRCRVNIIVVPFIPTLSWETLHVMI
jgi:hypothetical protein